MPSEGPIHLYVRHRLMRIFAALELRLPAGIVWLTDLTVRFSNDDVAIPDFTFGAAPVRDRPYTPEEILLAIEVGVTTAHYDRTVKRGDYGAAGLADYWLIEPGDTSEAGLVRVHSAPLDGEYGAVSIARPGDELALPFAPELKIAVSDFL